MRVLDGRVPGPGVPIADLARHKTAGKDGRIPGIKFAADARRGGLQAHVRLVRIVCSSNDTGVS